jgi:hypothetical protein
MIKITYSPIEEIVLHEIVKVEKDDLIRERVTPAGNMPLYWCDGTLFSFSSLPMTDDVVKEYLKGRIHWLELHFCKMEEYTPLISVNDDAYKGTITVRVIDTSSSVLHKELIKWVKKNVK